MARRRRHIVILYGVRMICSTPKGSRMKEADVFRRRFALLTGTLVAGQIPLPGARALTAQDVIQRIQTSLGGEWLAGGPDGFKAGDPNTPVKGIATTAMATLAVLKQASNAGTNLIVTYEPT